MSIRGKILDQICESVCVLEALIEWATVGQETHGLEKDDLTETVIGSAFEVSRVLGAGFLEKVYERALIRELTLRGVSAKAQVSFPFATRANIWPMWWLRTSSWSN